MIQPHSTEQRFGSGILLQRPIVIGLSSREMAALTPQEEQSCCAKAAEASVRAPDDSVSSSDLHSNPALALFLEAESWQK